MFSKANLQTLLLAGYIVLMISGFMAIVLGALAESDLEHMYHNKEILLEVQMDTDGHSNVSSVLHDVFLGNKFHGVITVIFSTVFPFIFWKRNSQLFLAFCLCLMPVLLMYQGILLDMWIGIKRGLDCCRKEGDNQTLSGYIADTFNSISATQHQCINEYSARSCMDSYVMWINKWYISSFSLPTVQILVEVSIFLLAIILLRQDETVKCLLCTSQSRVQLPGDSSSAWIIEGYKRCPNERRSSLPKRQSVRIIVATDRHIYTGLNVFTIDV